jgi:hypothetical protein
MKVFTTAIFSVMILNRSLHLRKWRALLTLTLGVVLISHEAMPKVCLLLRRSVDPDLTQRGMPAHAAAWRRRPVRPRVWHHLPALSMVERSLSGPGDSPSAMLRVPSCIVSV